MSAGPSGETVKVVVPLADLSAVEEALGRGDPDALRTALRAVRPADVGRELSRLTLQDCKRLLEALDDRRAAAMLRAAHPRLAANALLLLDPDHAGRLLAYLPLDVQASILGGLGAEERALVERGVAEETRRQVERLVSHPETSVGRLMTPKVWRVERGKTVADALTALRERATAIEVAANCYVVDAEQRVLGVVPLRELAISPGETPLEQLMVKDVISVGEECERADAAEIITTHNFLSLPVVDHEKRLVGAVTVDDLLEAALSKVGTGFLNQAAVVGEVAAALPYFQTPLTRVVRSRITWLVLLFVAETATGTVLRHFEDALHRWVQLSFFIPLLIGTGGNAGSQTVSTVIRALALGEARVRDVLRVLWKESSAGLLLGVLLGVIAFFRAGLWGCGHDICFCVGATIVVVCTWANTVGALIPIAAEKVGVDPTVVSGPLITTLVDASGLFLYLTIAQAILR
jgi:magnesium transporter